MICTDHVPELEKYCKASFVLSQKKIPQPQKNGYTSSFSASKMRS